MAQTKDVTPLTLISNDVQAQAARARLLSIRGRILDTDDEIVALTERRGDALGAAELGIDGSQKHADTIGLKIADLDSQRNDLDAMVRSLQSALDRWEQAERERKGAAAETEIAKLAAEAEDLEQRYAATMIDVAKMAQRLRVLRKQMAKLQPAIFEAGRGFDQTPMPRTPKGLQLSVIKNPEKEMGTWLRPRRVHRNRPTPEFVPTFADGRRIPVLPDGRHMSKAS